MTAFFPILFRVSSHGHLTFTGHNAGSSEAWRNNKYLYVNPAFKTVSSLRRTGHLTYPEARL